MKFQLPKFDIKQPNIGPKDRLIRVIVAVLLLFGFYNGGFKNWIIALIGLGLLATAYYRFCPAYKIGGIDTNQDQTKDEQ